jgi:hypothetical protein
MDTSFAEIKKKLNLEIFAVEDEPVVGHLRNVLVRHLDKVLANLASLGIIRCWVQQNWGNVFEPGSLGVVLKPKEGLLYFIDYLKGNEFCHKECGEIGRLPVRL